VAFIHKTASLVPSKLELLTAWLPQQSWYVDTGAAPHLTRAGGFRLDDPDGEVGIEFFFVTDEADGIGTTYHVPMSYRGAPLRDAEDALIGAGQHDALGPRFVYDGVHDPVVLAAIRALVEGRAQPQHQTESNTPDPTVQVRRAAGSEVDTTGVQVLHVLSAGSDVHDGAAWVEASWRRPDGSEQHGPVIVKG